MMKNFQKSLLKLKNVRLVQISDNSGYPDESGSASIVMVFSDGTRLRADYWRIIKNNKALIPICEVLLRPCFAIALPRSAEGSAKAMREGKSPAKDEASSGISLIRWKSFSLFFLQFQQMSFFRSYFPASLYNQNIEKHFFRIGLFEAAVVAVSGFQKQQSVFL